MTDFERHLPSDKPVTAHRDLAASLSVWLHVTVWSTFALWITLLIIRELID